MPLTRFTVVGSKIKKISKIDPSASVVVIIIANMLDPEAKVEYQMYVDDLRQRHDDFSKAWLEPYVKMLFEDWDMRIEAMNADDECEAPNDDSI